MDGLNEQKLKELKAHAYDLQAMIQKYQAAFTSTNNQIANLLKVIEEEKKSKEIKKEENKESKNLKPKKE